MVPRHPHLHRRRGHRDRPGEPDRLHEPRGGAAHRLERRRVAPQAPLHRLPHRRREEPRKGGGPGRPGLPRKEDGRPRRPRASPLENGRGMGGGGQHRAHPRRRGPGARRGARFPQRHRHAPGAERPAGPFRGPGKTGGRADHRPAPDRLGAGGLFLHRLARSPLAPARHAGLRPGRAGGLRAPARRAGGELPAADQERRRAARPAHPGPPGLHPHLAPETRRLFPSTSTSSSAS